MKYLSPAVKILLIYHLFLIFSGLTAQDQALRTYGVDYNDKYRAPFAVGVEYQSLNPITQKYSEEYRYTDLAVSGKYSFEEYPEIQPSVSLGLQFVSPLVASNELTDAKRFSITFSTPPSA